MISSARVSGRSARVTVAIVSLVVASSAFSSPGTEVKLRHELAKSRQQVEHLKKEQSTHQFSTEDTRIAIGLASIVVGWSPQEATTVFTCESNLDPHAYNSTPLGGAHATGAAQQLFNVGRTRSSTYHTTAIGARFPTFRDAQNPYVNILGAALIWDRMDLRSPLGDRRGSFVEWRDRCSHLVGD